MDKAFRCIVATVRLNKWHRSAGTSLDDLVLTNHVGKLYKDVYETLRSLEEYTTCVCRERELENFKILVDQVLTEVPCGDLHPKAFDEMDLPRALTR
eukprot:2297951-Pyramimonas_sp.AAC.1